MMDLHEFHDIDSYIAGFPEDIRNLQTELRAVIKQAAPEATEKISYSMPTFYQHGNLVHFAAYKNHVGFYPAASGIEAFKAELSALYNSGWKKTGKKYRKRKSNIPDFNKQQIFSNRKFAQQKARLSIESRALHYKEANPYLEITKRVVVSFCVPLMRRI
jgi:uncharacterized protein YdhG (YjbR/CyaY superfamily)